MARRSEEQNQSRQVYTYRDDHDREYLTIVDTDCRPHLAPCCPLQPIGWKAPIMPPDNFLVPDPRQLGRLTINYVAWLEQEESTERLYLAQARAIAESMFKDDATQAIERRDPRLLAELGPPPASPMFVRAAMSGKSDWVLGKSPLEQVPEWAKKYLSTLPQYRPQLRAAEIEAMDFRDDPTDAEDVLETPEWAEAALEGSDDTDVAGMFEAGDEPVKATTKTVRRNR